MATTKTPTTDDIRDAITRTFPEACKELGAPAGGVYERDDGTLIINTEAGDACSYLFDYWGNDHFDNELKLGSALHDAGFCGFFERENAACSVWIVDAEVSE